MARPRPYAIRVSTRKQVPAHESLPIPVLARSAHLLLAGRCRSTANGPFCRPRRGAPNRRLNGRARANARVSFHPQAGASACSIAASARTAGSQIDRDADHDGRERAVLAEPRRRAGQQALLALDATSRAIGSASDAALLPPRERDHEPPPQTAAATGRLCEDCFRDLERADLTIARATDRHCASTPCLPPASKQGLASAVASKVCPSSR